VEASIIVAAIGAAAGLVATVGGWIATWRLRASERRLAAAQSTAVSKAEEAAAAVAERQRIDARWERLVDELQAEIDRLRRILTAREDRLS
jgi:hypothetical protein